MQRDVTFLPVPEVPTHLFDAARAALDAYVYTLLSCEHIGVVTHYANGELVNRPITPAKFYKEPSDGHPPAA